MAKKAQAVQLQTEVTNDDEWEKLLQRDGLLVVDIYSNWCGPCSGMAANLKKIKLELGGDLLQLAIAKCDNITVLTRFRNKSEPTWMFIVNGKMVNFMYGANAPKLMRLITDELKKETEARQGVRERVEMEISEMAEEERERFEAAESIVKAAKAIEEQKRAAELLERRTAECNNILENLSNLGVIIIFPNAKDIYQQVLGELFAEAGLVINTTEKVFMNQTMLDELFYFADEQFPDETLDQVLTLESRVLLMKPSPNADELTTTIVDKLAEIVYGHSKQPPGSDDSPAQLLLTLQAAPVKEEDDTEGDQISRMSTLPVELIGIWTPLSELNEASALKIFFPKLVQNYLVPEPEEIPPHLIFAFEALRRHDIMKIAENYRPEILHYGFFTSEVSTQAELVAKNLYKYEKVDNKTFQEKLILQISKRKSECVFAFAQLTPLYISPNAKEGELEAKNFFPENYDEPPDEEEEEMFILPENATETADTIIDENQDDLENEDFEDEEEDYDEDEEYEELEISTNMDELDYINDFPPIADTET